MITRRIMTTGLAAGAASLLSSCGTIIYPERVNQKHRGDLDVMVVGMDAVGLIFFLIPGLIAFAVDFGTGAIYFPEEHDKGKREKTIFDKIDSQAKLDQTEIERIVAQRTGESIDLERAETRVMRIEHLNQFPMAFRRLSSTERMASI